MLVSSYGAIEQRQLGAGEVLKIDTGHIVAFTDGIGYEVNKVGGWKSTLLSGGGSLPVSPAREPLWIQTHQSSRLPGVADPAAADAAQLVHIRLMAPQVG